MPQKYRTYVFPKCAISIPIGGAVDMKANGLSHIELIESHTSVKVIRLITKVLDKVYKAEQ